MDTTGIITAMILVCLGLIVLMVFAKPLKILLRIGVNAVAGSIAIFVLHSFGLGVGVNIFTAAFVGLLGIPGLAGLLAINFFL